jgi:hypothetical protein
LQRERKRAQADGRAVRLEKRARLKAIVNDR